MSNWISVDERLPSAYVETVLVARHSSCVCPAVMAAYHNGDNFISTSICGNNIFVDPTHWQPLPEPPK